MGTDQHGPAPAKRGDQRPDLQDLQGVQSHCGLVQDHDLRCAQQGLGNAHPLPVALAEGIDAPAAHLADAGLLDGILDLSPQSISPQALCLAHESQILCRRLPQIERRLFRQIADPPLGLLRLLVDVIAGDPDCAAGGGQAAGHDVHCRGLAGAVGAQKAVDTVIRDLKTQVVHGGDLPIPPGQMFNLKHDAPPFAVNVNILGTGP